MCRLGIDVRFRKFGIIKANTEVISFKQRMKDLGLKELVMEEVKRPVYHFEVKGRFYAYRKKFEDTIKFMNHL